MAKTVLDNDEIDDCEFCEIVARVANARKNMVETIEKWITTTIMASNKNLSIEQLISSVLDIVLIK